MKKIFSILAVMSAILLCSLRSSAQQAAADNVATTELKVTNLTCNGDMPTIKKQLLNQDGITEVNFTARNNGTSTFTVQYQAGVTDRKGIIKVIETTPGCDDKSSTPYKVKKEKGQL